MKVLVTGANGFVGRALCPYLTGLGHEVVAAVRRECDVPGARVVGDESSWQDALSRCETVVHLAGRAHVMHENAADPLQAFRAANVDATVQLAHRAAAAGVRRFIFVSTLKVNGEQTAPGISFDAEKSPQPQDPYAVSKWEAEQALHELASGLGMQVVILRPPLMYGPGVKANFRKLMDALVRGLPLPLGSVRNQRSLLYVGNLVDAIAVCLSHPHATGKTYVLSDAEDISTPELVTRLARALGTTPRLLKVPSGLLRLAGVLTGKNKQVDRLLGSLVLDSSAIRKDLEWTPPYSMQHGLQETAAWYRSHRNNEATS